MNKLCTHIVIHESFLLHFIPKIATRLEEAEAPCFMKNTSASGSSKSQMLPSLLPLSQKFNRFHRFRFPGLICFDITHCLKHTLL